MPLPDLRSNQCTADDTRLCCTGSGCCNEICVRTRRCDVMPPVCFRATPGPGIGGCSRSWGACRGSGTSQCASRLQIRYAGKWMAWPHTLPLGKAATQNFETKMSNINNHMGCAGACSVGRRPGCRGSGSRRRAATTVRGGGPQPARVAPAARPHQVVFRFMAVPIHCCFKTKA
jgi:hypothetical protein